MNKIPSTVKLYFSDERVLNILFHIENRPFAHSPIDYLLQQIYADDESLSLRTVYDLMKVTPSSWIATVEVSMSLLGYRKYRRALTDIAELINKADSD